ncbi:MAG: phytanoyl-CoA dioxygenase family protein [Chloroflexi bacterium]|nr:phytanoyl-CoA dioxygenase family protein [Chloroflexota bacterium]MCY3938822.1 phytanoyl-CoA dioxygenase family protein [Chloroflexota bacterium]
MLTSAELEQFDRDGYLVFPALLGEEKRQRYVAAFDELVERAKELKTDSPPTWTLERDSEGKPLAGVLHKVQGVCVVDFRALFMAQEPEITSRVESLIGPEMAIFGTKFFPKLAGDGTSVHWHQDNFYFDSDSDQIISCGIYLEDADRTNGCLRVIPGSHKQGIAEHERPDDVDAKGYRTEIDESKAVDVVCPGGTVVLFSANLLHGTNDNESDAATGRSRYSTAWHYLSPDTDIPPYSSGSYADWHVLS